MIITYTAFDGKTFNDQKECEDYEDKLKLLGLAYSEFSNFLITFRKIIMIIFGYVKKNWKLIMHVGKNFLQLEIL